MNLPTAETPLYNHPLPSLEQWLRDLGASQNNHLPHQWHLDCPPWQAVIDLDIEAIAVCYRHAAPDGNDVYRTFRYSLSRADVEAAILAGP